VGEAGPLIDRLLPELLFLDIQMPGGTGFDLLERLEHLPRVVFTTAYDRHAVRAFEVNALDYLLKPIEPARLAAALARAQAAAANVPAAPATAPVLERLFLRDGDRCWFVPLREVKLFAAEGNYVRLSWDRIHPLLGAGRSRASNHAWIRSGSFVPTASRSSISNTSKVWSLE